MEIGSVKYNQVECGPAGTKVNPKSKTGVLLRRPCEDTETRRDNEGRDGITYLQAREHRPFI